MYNSREKHVTCDEFKDISSPILTIELPPLSLSLSFLPSYFKGFSAKNHTSELSLTRLKITN